MTQKVLRHIAAQVEAVMASAEADIFSDEGQLNQYLWERPVRAQALLWLIFIWCYQHQIKIDSEQPGASRSSITVVSTRSELLVASQHLSTLRRMLSTMVFSGQWDKPCSRLLLLYARQNSAIRMLALSKLEESFKGAALAQLDAASLQFIPRDAHFTLLRHAEVGGRLMREHAVFEPVPLPLYR